MRTNTGQTNRLRDEAVNHGDVDLTSSSNTNRRMFFIGNMKKMVVLEER